MGPAPLVVFIHGGGFRQGDKDIGPQKFGLVATLCLQSGISFASINYRLLPDTPLWEIVGDGARAIQFLRSKSSEWNIDSKRIAAFGGSAGAGMSLWAAYHPDLADPNSADPVARQSSRLTAVGAFAGQASYDPKFWQDLLGPEPAGTDGARREPTVLQLWATPAAAGLKPAQLQARYDEVAAITHISPDDPPSFFYNPYSAGPARDQASYVHHPKHQEALARKLAAVRVPVTARLAHDYRGRGLDPEQECRREFVEFVKKHFTESEPR